jgi:hypothetical protein
MGNDWVEVSSTYGKAQHAHETEVTNTITKYQQRSQHHGGTEGGRRVASLHALHVSRLVVALRAALVAEMRRAKGPKQ